MTAKLHAFRSNLKKIDANPVAPEEYQDIPGMSDADIAGASRRVAGKSVTREQLAVAARQRPGKRRVSIMLDSNVIDFFKAKAGARGYQTLINQALYQAMQREEIEAALRRVIREELANG